jgi:hypothetical protein
VFTASQLVMVNFHFAPLDANAFVANRRFSCIDALLAAFSHFALVVGLSSESCPFLVPSFMIRNHVSAVLPSLLLHCENSKILLTHLW